MRGAKNSHSRLLAMLLAFAFSCASATRAEPGVLAFRAQGLTGFGRDLIVAWSETGQLQVLTLDGKAREHCRLPLQQLDQLVTRDGDLYVAGSVDTSNRSAMRIDTSCHVLERWNLSGGWAELATDARGVVIVTSEGTAELRPGGQFGPVVAHVRRGPERRPAPSALTWLAFEGSTVLCRKRDLSMRGSSPGWCALQRTDGWVATGEWDAAVACGGYVIVRTGLGAKQVRWEALRLDSGQRQAAMTAARGAYRCEADQFALADESVIKRLDPATLKVKSTTNVAAPIEQVGLVSNKIVYTSDGGMVVRQAATQKGD